MGGKKILIVDDDATMVKIVTVRLKANGYEVISANNGIEGLEKARNENPDAILLDIKMSQMDGHTMLRNLKKHGEKTKPIPVIILTAYAELRELFDLEGASDYIVKPFEAEDLLLRITLALRQKR